MAVLVLEFDIWQLFLFLAIFAVIWYASLLFILNFSRPSPTKRSKNDSRSRSQTKAKVFDDADDFLGSLASTPTTPPPPPPPPPELSPWVAYDDGTWQRLCSGGCRRGVLPGNHLCGTCVGSGYEVVTVDPYRSSRQMEASSMLPQVTTPQATQSAHAAKVTFSWPPVDLVESYVHDPVRQLDP